MKEIFKVVVLFFVLVIFSQCSKSNSNSDGIPLVPDNGGQVGFSSSGSVIITDPPSMSQPGGGSSAETISIINVPLTGVVTDRNKFIIEVNLAHNFQSDISLILVDPSGTEHRFVDRAGSDQKYKSQNKLRFGAAFTNVLPSSIDFPAGDYKESQGALSVIPTLSPIFDDIVGVNRNGAWKLKILDASNGGLGQLISWRIIFN